jgi:LCP family protein required for cell wall assembly
MVIMGTYETPSIPPITAIPPAAPTPVASGDDIVTVLLLGSDTITPGAVARTDVIILLAIDRTTNTVSMIHLPRDIVVYAPNYTMAKINTIMNYGNVTYGPGGGAKLIKETIQYNFGIKVDFYARVDFMNFQDIIAKLGGLDISVDCAIQGHRLKPPYNLDVTLPESYELYTMPVGYRHLDPYMALWYVRSRGSSSDFQRGQRQMDVLRAMWRQAKSAGLLAQVTELWPEAQKLAETDMTLQDVLGLLPVAASVDPVNIQRINVGQDAFTQWYTSDTGSYALLPKFDVWKTIIQNFVMPPPVNRLGGEAPTVEVGAPLSVKGYEQVATDRLSWEGFAAKSIGQEGVVNRTATVIIDYTGNAKPNSRAALMKILRVKAPNVIDKPDPNRTVDFRVEMGRDYGQCIYALPPEFQDAPATPTPAQ